MRDDEDEDEIDETDEQEPNEIDPDVEQEEEEEEEAETPFLEGEELNAKLFRDSVQMMIEAAVPGWQLQVELLVGKSVQFVPDFDSLAGRFDRVGPFVQLAVAGTLEALAKLRFDPECGAKLGVIRKIVVRATIRIPKNVQIDLAEGVMYISMSLDEQRPPTEKIAAAIKAAIE
jgi:hypothetical protein